MIELLTVVIILGIITTIAIPTVAGIIENSKKEVCYTKQVEIERMYEYLLELENLDHSDQRFTQYLNANNLNNSNNHGDDGYIDGKVHSNNEVPEGNNDGNIPFL